MNLNKRQVKLHSNITFQINKSLKRRNSLRPITIKWQNFHGFQCKHVVKQNICFCTHKYAQHQYHFAMQPYCNVKGCNCKCYQYIPHFDIKCLCKHSIKDHEKTSKKCKFCTKCNCFLSSWACKCGFKYHQHQTVIFEQWDKQLKALPKIQKQYFINNTVQVDRKGHIQQIQQKNGQTIPMDNHQKMLKKKLQQVNNRMLKIQSNYVDERQKSQNQKTQLKINLMVNHSEVLGLRKRQSIENIDYSGTPLELILTPHKYRFTNVQNVFHVKSKLNNNI